MFAQYFMYEIDMDFIHIKNKTKQNKKFDHSLGASIQRSMIQQLCKTKMEGRLGRKPEGKALKEETHGLPPLEPGREEDSPEGLR